MGMDFRYAGSASYPRFDEEICNIAKIFGGEKTEYLKQLELGYAKANWVTQMFGTISANCAKGAVKPKFSFPNGTPHDRNQYTNGYADGKNEVLSKIREEIYRLHREGILLGLEYKMIDEIIERVEK